MAATILWRQAQQRRRAKTEDKLILLQVSADNDEEINPYLWYVIEGKMKEKENEEKSSVLLDSKKRRNSESEEDEEMVKDLGNGNRIRLLSSIPPLPYSEKVAVVRTVYLNSRIYLVGGMRFSAIGSTSLINDVFYLDIGCPEDGWKRGPSLQTRRCSTYPIALCGIEDNAKKNSSSSFIYVMGPSVHPHHCWAEVLNVESDRGRGITLPQLPSWLLQMGPVTMHAVYDYGNKIMMYSYSSRNAFCYDIKRNLWSVIDENFGKWLGRGAMAYGHLFAYGKQDGSAPYSVYACRVSTGTFRIPVIGLKKDGVQLPSLEFDQFGEGTVNLFRINDQKLALVWSERRWKWDTEETVPSSKFVVHCVKFTVRKCYKCTKQKREYFFRARVSSAGACVVEGAILVNCMAIGIKEEEGGAVKEEDETEKKKKKGNKGRATGREHQSLGGAVKEEEGGAVKEEDETEKKKKKGNKGRATGREHQSLDSRRDEAIVKQSAEE